MRKHPWEVRGLRPYYVCWNHEDPEVQRMWDLVFAYTRADVETAYPDALIEIPMTDGEWEQVASTWEEEVAKREAIRKVQNKVVPLKRSQRRPQKEEA